MADNALELQLRELKDMISVLQSMTKSQTETINAQSILLKEKAEAEKNYLEQIRVQQEQIDYLTKKLFGSSSEKRSAVMDNQLSIFDEAEKIVREEKVKEIKVEAHTRKPKATHEEMFKGLPVEKVLIPLPKNERFCPECGTEMEKVGEEYVRHELKFIPASLKVIEYYTETYGCPLCKEAENGAEVPSFVKSQAPAALIPKSYASSSTVAWAMYQKYANAMPLYRQEKDWIQYGAKITRTTLANWVIYCANEYFKPLYDYFHRELLKRSFAMADETRVQVLKEPEREAEQQSFMWLFRSGEDGLPPIVLYGYTPTRNGDNAVSFLKGFKGYLETDGFQGYNKVPEVKRCSCWSHIRRYFIDAIPKGKQYDYQQPAVQGVQYCDQLFRWEDWINQRYPDNYEKRKQLRLEKEGPVLEAFWSWVDQQHPVRNSRMATAMTYVQNRRETAMTYLEDGRCSFTNNASENAIRPFTVGRKNWLFSDSVSGAEASAIVYTIVEMAKVYNLNIYEYLMFLLDNRPGSQMTDEELSELAPWSDMVQGLKNTINA